ncbi:uncharacterized protein LOC131596973 [Vicia villosa]|uniref:uncharacterized protein LOC131596973 n=1 Tax=Vicia villosa TaxID=3911 RepID=UPI00273ADBA7|nr:uncharacterized protein LOC131596973 [Vicia villosa]
MLALRGVVIPPTNIHCEFCRKVPENSNHFFFHCLVSKSIWGRIFLWIGEDINLTIEELMDFGSIQEKVKNIKMREKINTIWIATMWSLWLMRNTMVFDKVPFSFEAVCTNVMSLSWSWLDRFKPLSSSSFYEWYKLPLACFNSL